MPGTLKGPTSSSRMRSGRPFGRRTPRSAPPIGGGAGGPATAAGRRGGRGGPGRVAERFYDRAELAGLPEDTVRIALGVGNPIRYAALRPGERVVDLGSGGGIDCLLAARHVGPTWDVIGLDFLPT